MSTLVDNGKNPNPNIRSTQPVQAAINSITGGNTFQQKDVVSLHGRTAVVTGGTGGIGFEVAKTLALAGAKVVLLARSKERADEAMKQIRQAATEDPENSVTAVLEFIVSLS
jgi:FlaA1/EpsC-like NDP-sugar epimerase